MIVLKRIGIVVLVLIAMQIVTFYTIGINTLVEEIGRNYESYVLNIEENEFREIGIISELNPTKVQVEGHFNEFEPYDLKICKSTLDCLDLRETDYFYIYGFDFETKNPFTINLIKEGELAKEYGATWDSKYIWIFYKWILIEKINTGIS